MSEQTQNPLNQEQTAALVELAAEVATAIIDIPAQMETQARARLAEKFISEDAAGNFHFNVEKFEKAWDIITNPSFEPDQAPGAINGNEKPE
jgi:hypothetical protein